MSTIKTALQFIYLLIGPKIAFYRYVAASMTGNPAFGTPTVTMVEFTTQIDLVETKVNNLSAARTAVVLAEWELQQEEDKMDVMGRSLASYVEGASMGNGATLESSGFKLTATPEPVGLLPAPTGLRVETLQQGSCEFKWGRDRGVTSWIAEFAPQATGPWTQIYMGTRARCVAGNLVPGTQYWFRVQALGSAGPSDWSNPVTKRAV